jgi:hypothetical protein
VERGDRHFLFGADADLGVIVKTGEEIDIEGRIGGRADLTDDGPNLSAGVNPTPIAPIPPPAQTPRARSAVPPAKAMPALAKGWRQPKRSVIRVEMLPILSDLPQVTAFFDRYRVGANRLETQHALVERAGLVEVEGRKAEV